MADLFREVDEDLRRDNLEKIWKKYGKVFIAFFAAIVLAVGGIQAWRAYDQDRREGLSDRFATALATARGGDPAGAIAELDDFGAPGDGGYAGLAALERARLMAKSGDSDGAIAIWDSIAANSALGPGFRDIAVLISVLHRIDSGDPAALQARLEPLAGEAMAFRGSAWELMAVLALRGGDKAGAIKLYTKISDDREIPSGLRARAAQMLAALKS